MTTLYRPVPITSAEQAEALPDGAVLIRDEHFAFQKHADRFVTADPHDLPVADASEVIGWTALVPIEAEEETQGWGFCTPACPRGDHDHESPTRLVTPWEEAQ